MSIVGSAREASPFAARPSKMPEGSIRTRGGPQPDRRPPRCGGAEPPERVGEIARGIAFSPVEKRWTGTSWPAGRSMFQLPARASGIVRSPSARDAFVPAGRSAASVMVQSTEPPFEAQRGFAAHVAGAMPSGTPSLFSSASSGFAPARISEESERPSPSVSERFGSVP